jgi:hypothetical protein
MTTIRTSTSSSTTSAATECDMVEATFAAINWDKCHSCRSHQGAAAGCVEPHHAKVIGVTEGTVRNDLPEYRAAEPPSLGK